MTLAARLRLGGLGLVLAGAALLPGLGAEAQGGEAPARIVAGKSVQKRAIRALRLGDPDAKRVGLVVGVIHGDERAGLRVTRALRRRWRNVKGAQIWVVDTVNPDGLKAGTRKNARGVDLNRNFPYRWSSAEPPSSGYYSGPRPFSEPESRAARALIKRIEPDVSIWYHQPWGAVLACRGRPRIAARYARLTRMRTSCRGKGLPGTAISWQKRSFPSSNAFVVEFGRRTISGRAARRNAWAAVKVIRGGAEADQAGAAPGPVAGSSGLRPRIRKWRIPYGKKRKRDMAAYSKRHYGKAEWRLLHPKLIVQHVSVTDTVEQVYNTFAPNRPDVEYGELPGVCSHFVISPKGRIYKFVPVTIRCRHVVGLNHVSIGIEHVGHRDGDVLKNKRMLRASLRLTRYLRCRESIAVKRVIGHNESLDNPFYRERDPDFRGRTHGDFKKSSMKVYRRKLKKLGGC